MIKKQKTTAKLKPTISLTASSLKLKTGQSTTAFKASGLAKGTTYTKLTSSITVAPVTSQEKITYSSSDKKIVTVTSKGVVKGVRKGTATITIRSGSKKITCKITVK